MPTRKVVTEKRTKTRTENRWGLLSYWNTEPHLRVTELADPHQTLADFLEHECAERKEAVRVTLTYEVPHAR